MSAALRAAGVAADGALDEQDSAGCGCGGRIVEGNIRGVAAVCAADSGPAIAADGERFDDNGAAAGGSAGEGAEVGRAAISPKKPDPSPLPPLPPTEYAKIFTSWELLFEPLTEVVAAAPTPPLPVAPSRTEPPSPPKA